MLLNEITLTNFRQFNGNHTIKFSTDSEHNVTIIMGANGSGKTTFSQAFTWCLYGKTDFNDESIINKAILQEMQPDDKETVSVKLNLEHKNTIYTILRTQDYKMNQSYKLESHATKLIIHYKTEDGQYKPIKESLVNSKIREILPKELSGYFFFDGERIEKMSKEIQFGKSDEFAQAVKKLLGLDTYTAAITHLGGKSRAGKNSSVIGSYNSKFSSSADDKIKHYTQDIEKYEEQLIERNNRKHELENQIQLAEKECDYLIAKIGNAEDSKKLQEKINNRNEHIRINNNYIDKSTESILSSFKKNYKYYFFKKMASDAIQLLSNIDNINPRIPNINKKTIECLLQQEVCICGNKISQNSNEYQFLKQLLEIISSNSNETLIDTFINECKHRNEVNNDIFKDTETILIDLKQREKESEDYQDEIDDLEEKIKNLKIIGEYQRKLENYRNDINKKRSESDKISIEIGQIKTKCERVETERDKLALQSKDNKKIFTYLSYAKEIHKILEDYYKNREDEIRKKFENTINDIFSTIYKGNLSLQIDERYNIKTIANGYKVYNTGIETGNSESISIIFAFISGIIKLAKEATTNKEIDLSTETYPLVMDAPLSAFDKERIQTVCETLPKIAEQVIIFIKNTDGEIAEKYLSDNIGMKYEFDKKNTFETYIIERS